MDPASPRFRVLMDATRVIRNSPHAPAITLLLTRGAGLYNFAASSRILKGAHRERIIFLAFGPASRSWNLQDPPAQTFKACRRPSRTTGDVPAAAWNCRQLYRAIRRSAVAVGHCRSRLPAAAAIAGGTGCRGGPGAAARRFEPAGRVASYARSKAGSGPVNSDSPPGR